MQSENGNLTILIALEKEQYAEFIELIICIKRLLHVKERGTDFRQ